VLAVPQVRADTMGPKEHMVRRGLPVIAVSKVSKGPKALQEPKGIPEPEGLPEAKGLPE